MTYYIAVGDDHIVLDAHEDIEVNYSGRTTSHPTQRKISASDNYILDNPTASFNGYVSDVQSPYTENTNGAGGYIDKLVAAMSLNTPVKFKHRLDGVEEDNWFITSFNYAQDNEFGYGGTRPDGKIIQSFYISVQLERVVLAQGATEDVRVDPKYTDSTQTKKDSASSTKDANSDVKQEDKILKEKFIENRDFHQTRREGGSKAPSTEETP